MDRLESGLLDVRLKIYLPLSKISFPFFSKIEEQKKNWWGLPQFHKSYELWGYFVKIIHPNEDLGTDNDKMRGKKMKYTCYKKIADLFEFYETADWSETVWQFLLLELISDSFYVVEL